MKHKTWTLLLIALTLFMTACAPADNRTEDAKFLIKRGAFLVDVRSKQEYDGGHLEGAILIPHTELEQNMSKFPKDKQANIVVYCRSGRRSGFAKEFLEGKGYTNVVNGGGYSDLKD